MNKSSSVPDLFSSKPRPPDIPGLRTKSSRCQTLQGESLPLLGKIPHHEQSSKAILQQESWLKEGSHHDRPRSKLVQRHSLGARTQQLNKDLVAARRRRQEDEWEQEFRKNFEEELRHLPNSSHSASMWANMGVSCDNGCEGFDNHLRVGSEVKLHGLCITSALNGMLGTCTKWHSESGRWDVLLENGETVCLNTENITRRAAMPFGSAPIFEVGDLVELHGLCTRPELNGMRGNCVAWDANKGRWDVRVDCYGSNHVSLRPQNLSKVSLHNPSKVSSKTKNVPLALQSNNGWKGKSVRSWMFGNALERVTEEVGRVVITVHTTGTYAGEKVTCTNMAGHKVVVIDSPLKEVTFKQVLSAVAESSGCHVGDIHLVTSGGQTMLGFDHWTLAEAKLK